MNPFDCKPDAMHTCPDCGQECDCDCGDRPPEIGCTHDCWEPVEYEDYPDDFS